jgi:hypothetical protein
MLKSKSEKEFFRIVAENRIVNLKYLYRKVCRQQVYTILKMLEILQKRLNILIFEKKAKFCQVTGLPIVELQFINLIKIEYLDNNTITVIQY